MSDERWLPVAGWPDYQVSDLGRVRRWPSGRIKRPHMAGRDRTYPYVHLWSENRRWSVSVHALVARAFIGPRPPDHDVDHIDRDPSNPAATNLRYLHTAHNRSRYRDELDTRYGPERSDWSAWEADSG